jgi:uncharacterized protein (DUF58 family)
MHYVFWALIVLFAVAAFLRMDWVYYLVYLVGGVWIFSHVWMRRSLGSVQMAREMPPRAFAGEVIDARLRLYNRSWLPLPWLQIQEAVPFDLKQQADYRTVVSVGARSTVEHAYQLACKKRGYYQVGPLNLRSSDLFGFVEARWEESRPATLIVYPQVVALERLGLPSRSPFGSLAGRRQLLEDPARMAGVRAYSAGDSLRRIHWKASAHVDELLVKKLQPSMAVPVLLLLDLDRGAYSPRSLVGSSEWAITVAASLASALIAERQAVGLASNGLDALAGVTAAPVPQRGGQEQLMSILSLLARIQVQAAELPLAEWLPRQTATLPWGTTVVVVTPQLDEASLWALHALFRRGSSVLAVLCAAQPELRALRARAAHLGVGVHSTIWDSDLRALDRGRFLL